MVDFTWPKTAYDMAELVRERNIFQYRILSLKYKISAIWLVETVCIFLIFLIATVQISMECETQESEAGYTKHLNLY